MEETRFRRKPWNRTKSRLSKHTSQPELQLSHRDRPHFQCQDCGFVNTLLPLCLWCSWNPKGPEHVVKPTNQLRRRASAPATAFIWIDAQNRAGHQQLLLVTRTKDNTDSPLQENEDVGRLLNFKHRLGFASHDDITKLGNMESSRSSGTIASTEAVATATRKPSVVFALAQTTQQGEAEPPPATRTRSLTSPSLPSEEQPTVPSVDRSLMTSKKRSRTLRLKGSHQPLTIDIHGANLGPSSVSVDANKVPNNIDTKPSPELTAQQQRTLRRRKHLNVLQTSLPVSNAAEPIPISLNLHTTDDPRHSRGLSPPRSIATDTSSDPTTPPQTPTLTITPPTSAPARPASNSPGSSPVRLGHPSRPYYSAIRKNGITSRPLSSSGPSTTGSSRPQSYTPPSTTSALSSTTASRHLSMSAMFVSPLSSSPPGVPSAFSVMDDVDNDDEEPMPILPPTPAPVRTRFSLSSEKRRFSHGPILNLQTNAPKHTHSQSLSQARSKGPRGSIGFSMSGETELRMALAAEAAMSGTSSGSGFRFRESAVPPVVTQEDVVNANGVSHPRRNSFLGRVRKLRQGLKEMLLS